MKFILASALVAAAAAATEYELSAGSYCEQQADGADACVADDDCTAGTLTDGVLTMNSVAYDVSGVSGGATDVNIGTYCDAKESDKVLVYDSADNTAAVQVSDCSVTADAETLDLDCAAADDAGTVYYTVTFDGDNLVDSILACEKVAAANNACDATDDGDCDADSIANYNTVLDADFDVDTTTPGAWCAAQSSDSDFTKPFLVSTDGTDAHVIYCDYGLTELDTECPDAADGVYYSFTIEEAAEDEDEDEDEDEEDEDADSAPAVVAAAALMATAAATLF